MREQENCVRGQNYPPTRYGTKDKAIISVTGWMSRQIWLPSVCWTCRSWTQCLYKCTVQYARCSFFCGHFLRGTAEQIHHLSWALLVCVWYGALTCEERKRRKEVSKHYMLIVTQFEDNFWNRNQWLDCVGRVVEAGEEGCSKLVLNLSTH